MSVGALWRKTGTYFVPRIMDMGKLEPSQPESCLLVWLN